MGDLQRKKSGHKSNWSKVRYRELWNRRHPEGRKVFSLRRKIKRFQHTIEVMKRKLERLEKIKNLRE